MTLRTEPNVTLRTEPCGEDHSLRGCRGWWEGRRDLRGVSPAPPVRLSLSAPVECHCSSRFSPWLQPSGSGQSGDGSSLLLLFVVRLGKRPGRWAVQAPHFWVPVPPTQVWGEEGAAALPRGEELAQDSPFASSASLCEARVEPGQPCARGPFSSAVSGPSAASQRRVEDAFPAFVSGSVAQAFLCELQCPEHP